MSEIWKSIVCPVRECMAASLNDDGSVKEMARIFPEVDTPGLVRFTCPRCKYTEDWEEQRQQIAKILHERIPHVGVGK